MGEPIIVEEYRGGEIENIHQGVICVVNEQQEVIYAKGNIERHVFYRSAMKPIQAIPIFLTNILEEYHITLKEAALFMASQRGELYHEQALEQLLQKLQLKEDYLVCGESYPLNEAPKNAYIYAHKRKRKLLHNCAGKHLGFLAYAKEKGLPLDSYTSPNHPLQKEIYHYMKMLAEVTDEEVHAGMDGCGAPVYSIPLKNMAISYMKFGLPSLIEDPSLRKAVTKIGETMNAFPEMIASDQFVCSALLADQNIIAKGGAQGVYCFTLKEEGLSVALKVLSGSELVWPNLLADLLEKLNYQNIATIGRLRAIRGKDLLNDSGYPIGETKTRL